MPPSSLNDRAREYLDHYLDPNTPADAAVLLSGPWGSGKSHFLRDYMSARDASAAKSGTLPPASYLWASVYGVTSTEGIREQFFAQAHPKLNSAGVRLLGTLATRVVNATTPSPLFGDGDAKKARDAILNLRGRTLIFDDLERSGMPIADVMGFINAFVEQDGLKVIIVASEGDIPEAQKQDFERRKEKVVGKTLAVGSDPEQVYVLFANAIRHPAAKAAALKHQTAALAVFRDSAIPNFRSLRAILADFDRLVALADPRLAGSDPALRDLLRLMIATGLEVRAGNLSAETLPKLSDLYGLAAAMRQKSQWTEADSALKATADKYEAIDWRTPIAPLASLAELYTSGHIDVESVNAYIACHPAVVGVANVPAWRRLWSWFDLSATDYAEARRQFLDDLANTRIRHPGEILHAAGIVLRLKSCGDDLFPGQRPRSIFRGYLKQLRAAGALVPEIRVFMTSTETGWEGLGFQEYGTPAFEEIQHDVDVATNGAFADRMKAAAPDLMENLRDRGAYERLYEFGLGDPDFGGAAVLHYIALGDFEALALAGGTLNARLLSALAARYERFAHSGGLSVEAVWVARLHRRLKLAVKALGPPFRGRAERDLETYFSRMKTALARSNSSGSP